MEVWVLAREGVSEPFIALGFFNSGKPMGVEIRNSEIHLLREKEALRIIERAKRGERAFEDFVPSLDRAEAVEVDERLVWKLADLLKKHQRCRDRIVKLVREVVESGMRKEYIKLHVFPTRNKDLEEVLKGEFGPPRPGQWFYSTKYESYVFRPEFEQKLLEILRRVYGGKHLLAKGRIWTVLDQPFQDSQPL